MNKIIFLLLIMNFAFVSCSGLSSYYSKLENLMTKEKYEDAKSLASISKDAYGTKSEFLYYLDLGLLEHLSKNYSQSNISFEQAKQIYSKNYTKSISAATLSLFSNDTVIPYYGNTYEIAYVNVFCALNYILQGLDNEAVVEARQANNLFRKIKVDTHEKAFYKDDPFIRYFMGIVYENAQYYNDALISYKLALKGYENYSAYSLPVPQDLLYSLYDLYLKFSMLEEAEELKNKYDIPKKVIEYNYGELIVVNYNGISPKKVDNIIEMSIYNAWPYFNSVKPTNQEWQQAQQVRSAVNAGFSKDYIKIAFPKYVKFNNKITHFSIEEINFENKKTVQLENSTSTKVSDIATLMINVLEDNNTTIYAKTIARAVGRYVLAKVVVEQVKQKESKNNNTLSVLTNSILNIANSMLEKADKRSWRTLPETINISRIYIEEGTHTLNINFKDSSNNIVYTQQINVNIIKNKKNFVVVNSFKQGK